VTWKKLYVDVLKPSVFKKKAAHKPRKRFKFKTGDYVRLSSTKHIFQRDFEQKWTEEVFIIQRRFLRQGIPVYKITDYDNDPIEGTFCEFELQRVNKTRNDLWKIEKILKRCRRRGKVELFVKWQGYPKKFNSWVDGYINIVYSTTCHHFLPSSHEVNIMLYLPERIFTPG
jgi:hypothetical protein